MGQPQRALWQLTLTGQRFSTGGSARAKCAVRPCGNSLNHHHTRAVGQIPPTLRTDSWERDNSVASGPRNGRHNRQDGRGGDIYIRDSLGIEGRNRPAKKASRPSGSGSHLNSTLAGRIEAMPNPIASMTTARLLAEAISPLHFHDLHRLLSDPQVVRTLSADGKPLSEEATREQVGQNIDHWQQHGFGLWVFHRKSDGVFIGRGGLKTYQIDGKNVIGLAYAVMPDYWNRGFATEMAEASLDVGFNYLGFPEIGSWTLPVNLASQRVMEKLGFRYERDFDFAGLLHRFYRLAVEEWRAACEMAP